LGIPAPKPPTGSFDQAAAQRGEAIFNGKGTCASCHVPPLFTEPGWNLHTADQIGIDDFQAQRAPAVLIAGKEVVGYRTAPLKGLWAHQKGGFYHDGRYATLLDVVNHYDQVFKLGLTDAEKNDLIEYLKSLGDAVPPMPPMGVQPPPTQQPAVSPPPQTGTMPGMPRTGLPDALPLAGALSAALALIVGALVLWVRRKAAGH
jgi:hypothetical protein